VLDQYVFDVLAVNRLALGVIYQELQNFEHRVVDLISKASLRFVSTISHDQVVGAKLTFHRLPRFR
jgi:hypothetical protein